MDKIKKRLEKLTGDVLTCADPTSERGVQLANEVKLFQELSKTHKLFDGTSISDARVKQRLDDLTNVILKPRGDAEMFDTGSYISELGVLQQLVKAWTAADGIEIYDEQAERDRKSSRTWDRGAGSLTTKIPLTERQELALALLDSGQYDLFLALGGSGSGKSFIEAYKQIRDALRHKAPCLIARSALIDLRQGMIDQIIPSILGAIAKANGVEDWKDWKIDGLKFAKWTDKKTQLEFATGGYLRCGGLSARDLSESGTDKILSPSWLHVMAEEISELEYEDIEKLITRLRYMVEIVPSYMSRSVTGKISDGERHEFEAKIDALNLDYRKDVKIVIVERMHPKTRKPVEVILATIPNVFMMCENPPSINHWSYKHFFEQTYEDGSKITQEEVERMYALMMNPQDNVENLGETYIRNLRTKLKGANYERFYLGQFQDTETGEVFKRIQWTSDLPRAIDWDKLCIYTDPTPLTGKEYSKWADYKASVLVGMFDGNTYVLDVRIIRGSTLQMLQNVKQLYDASPNPTITDWVMENKQVPSDFDQVLLQFSSMTGWMIPVRKDKRNFGDKKAAIETYLQPLFENENIFFNAEWRDKERGRETQVQILKFSRKTNKTIHDDIPDAIMKADTWMKGKQAKRRKRGSMKRRVITVTPAYIQR